MRVKCLKCNDIITSKHRRDFRLCSCESVAVDGGDVCPRIIGNQEDWYIVEEDD